MKIINTVHSQKRIEERGINPKGLRNEVLRAYMGQAPSVVMRERIARLILGGYYEGVVAVCEVRPKKIRIITVYRQGVGK